MTQPNQSELEQKLDEVLAVFANYDESCEPGYEDVVLSRIERAKQAIKQLINAEIARTLDSLEAEFDRQTYHRANKGAIR